MIIMSVIGAVAIIIIQSIRFGRSINRRAPARFLLELKIKAEAVGGVYAEVDTKEFKACLLYTSRCV